MNKFVLKTLLIAACAFVMPFAVSAQESTPISVSCKADVDAANIGDTVTWTSTVSGGEAPYAYQWSKSKLGSEESAVSGNDETATKTYTTSGSYGAQLTVADLMGNMTTVECKRLTVIAPLEFASCTPSETASTVGYETTWTVKLKGGIAPYGFTLTGTDGLSAETSPAKITYTTAGVKTATVSNIWSSDGQVLTGSFNCTSATVEATVAKLQATCKADDRTVQVNDRVEWTVSVSGGKAPYAYAWTGTDDLTGSGDAITKRYTTKGDKTAKVNVASADGQVASNVSCTTSVEVARESSGGSSNSGSRNNSNSTTNRTTTTATNQNVPTNVVTFNSNTGSSSNRSQGSVLGTSTSTEAATSTVADAESAEAATSTESKDDAQNSQLANALGSLLNNFGFWLGIILILIAIALGIFLTKKSDENKA